MANRLAVQQTDRDAVANRIRLQFIRREIETAFRLARLALTEEAVGRSELAEEARRRPRKTYEDFLTYLPLVSDQLTGSEKGECEHSLESLRDALSCLE